LSLIVLPCHDRPVTADQDSLANLPDTYLMTPTEVAAIFRVDPKTVARWAASGRLASVRTPGGHRRFRVSEVRKALNGTGVRRWAAD
jgi:excisionase family DNA binding protein